MEPRYVSVDEDGNSVAVKHPKWSQPGTDLAKKALAICGRKYFLKGEKGRWIKIERAMMPLASGTVSVYPSEWVEHMLTWASKKNRTGVVIIFPRLLSGIENKDHINDFVARWKADNPAPTIDQETVAKVEAPPEEAEKFDWN